MGAIWRMGIQSHYTRDAAHSGKLVAAVWRKIWEDLQVSDCGCSPFAGSQDLTLINIQNQMLIQTWYQLWIDAGQDIQLVFPGAPLFFDSDPGDSGPEIDQRTRALCMAINSWVDELMNRGLSYAEEAGVAVGAFVAGGKALPYVSVWVIVGGFVASAFVLGELAQELASTAYRQYLICGMYEALKGAGINDPTAFAESWDNLPVRPPPPQSLPQDIARNAIEAWGRSQLNNLDNYLAFIKTLDIAMGVAGELEDADCTCISGWEETWLAGFDNAGDWTLEKYDPTYDITTYDAAEDRFDGQCKTAAVVGAKCHITFPSTTITRIRISVSWNATRATTFDDTEIGTIAAPQSLKSCSHGTGVGSHTCDTGVISEVMEDIQFRAAAGVLSCGSAYARITKIIVNGEGINPFL
jgi:hypothetical protein